MSTKYISPTIFIFESKKHVHFSRDNYDQGTLDDRLDQPF